MCYSVPCCSNLEDGHRSTWALLSSVESGAGNIPDTLRCISCFFPGQWKDDTVRSVSNTSDRDVVSNVEEEREASCRLTQTW